MKSKVEVMSQWSMVGSCFAIVLRNLMREVGSSLMKSKVEMMSDGWFSMRDALPHITTGYLRMQHYRGGQS